MERFEIKLYDGEVLLNENGMPYRVSTDTSLLCEEEEALAVAESIRIANPDCCVNVIWNFHGEQRSFVLYPSWECQMDEYPESPVHTPEGAVLTAKALESFVPFRDRVH